MKFSFKNKQGLTLKGELWPGDDQAVVIMAHGSGSNYLAYGLFPALAQELSDKGFPTLTFNFSGHGSSDDAVFTLQQSIDDVSAAIDFANDRGYQKTILLGASMGAYASLANYCPEVKALVCVGGLTGPVGWRWEDLCSEKQLAGLKETGYVQAEVNDGLREQVLVDSALLDHIRAIDQKALFEKVECPVLIIHGDSDQQERDLHECTKRGLNYLSTKDFRKNEEWIRKGYEDCCRIANSPI